MSKNFRRSDTKGTHDCPKHRSVSKKRKFTGNQYTIKQCPANNSTSAKKLLKLTTTKAPKINRSRTPIMKNMERILTLWIQEQNSKNSSINIKAIQNKAKTIFNELKLENAAMSLKNFDASRGWFERFKRRANLGQKPGGIIIFGENRNGSDQLEISQPFCLSKFYEKHLDQLGDVNQNEDLQFPNITLNSIKEEIHSPNEDEYEEEIYQEESYPSPLPELEPGPPSPKLIKLESLPSETASSINSSPIEHPVIDTTFTEINNETPTQTNIELFTDNELDVTAKSIAMKMKKLTPEMRLHAEKLITDVLYYAQLGDLKRTSHVTP